MAEQDQNSTVVSPPQTDENFGAGAGTGAATLEMPRVRSAPPLVDCLPKWKVLLHNSDEPTGGEVVTTIIMLTRVAPRQAMLQMIEAHTQGVALLLTTHREHAELLAEQFASRKLTVTIEPEI